jgi:hypothetical protein
MREPPLSQKARFILLLIDVVILSMASRIAFGTFIPAGDDKGFWFYTALLGLIFGSRLDTPFFAKPADVVLYAAPAAITLALSNHWSDWDGGVKVAFALSVLYCILAALLGAAAILTVDTKYPSWQQASNAARILAETLGAPRTIYSIVVAFALFAFHRSSAKELGLIGGAWILTAVFSPLEGALKIKRRIQRIFKPDMIFDADGEVAAFQTPGLVLIRQFGNGKVKAGDVVAVHDPLGKLRLTLVLDHVGRDTGLLMRTIEIAGAVISPDLRAQLSALSPNGIVRLKLPDEAITKNRMVEFKDTLVGLVCEDTSVERLLFDVVQDNRLEEGLLVEVQIGQRIVTYQIINGITKEDVVQSKNTNGFARAQAQKIGVWDEKRKRFHSVKWLPSSNSPVFLRTTTQFHLTIDAIGHFPGTDCPVSVKSVHDLVTHNTAILGILGIGKSMLAIELVERILAAGIKAICVDLTNQYSTELSPYIDAKQESTLVAELQKIGASGKVKVSQHVEEGGSKAEFAKEIGERIRTFVTSKTAHGVMVFNPSDYEVWRQDSKPFNSTASMASLSPAEITQIISEATLDAVASLGLTKKARVCLVYEEAHSLVPEWNSAVADGDKTASNGSARAILQGRKYGLGCLLIAQRTANVTKTILNQCNTIFAMRTFDDTGKDFLANYIGDAYASTLSSLNERQAVFFGKASSCENPILIQLNDREKFIEAFRAANPPPSLELQPPSPTPAVLPTPPIDISEGECPF